MATETPLRILVVANKTWECEPLVNVLLSKGGPPASLSNFKQPFIPNQPDLAIDPLTGAPPAPPPEADGIRPRSSLPPRPRLTFDIKLDNKLASVEVWCVEDWMRLTRHTTGEDKKVFSSSSHEKFTVALPTIRSRAFNGSGCDLVIAFGTAGIPSEQSFNGCVTIGSRVYINDPWDNATDAEKDSQRALFGPLLQKELEGWLKLRLDCPRWSSSLFTTGISAESRYAAEGRFLDAPINPAHPPRILAGHGYAALGTINICNYDDYVWADEETLGRFALQVKQREIGSSETTHGLIRLIWHDTPFLFVSALTDRVPYFNAEVTPRSYSQNFAAAHNGGVAIAHLLPELTRLGKANLFNDAEKTISCETGPLPLVPGWKSIPASTSCPRYELGEIALDCPWAEIARKMGDDKTPDETIAILGALAPNLVTAIRVDASSPECLNAWGQCLNFDELALGTIVAPSVLSAIAKLAGLSPIDPGWHAGLTHTYGYLFSLLRTGFGYKRKRWVSPELARGFRLPPESLGPTPSTGSFLSNVTWFFGHFAFRGEAAALTRLTTINGQVSPELRDFSYDSCPKTRVVETVTVAGPRPGTIELRTDLVALPEPGSSSHLLIYSVNDSRENGPRLISGFPVAPGMYMSLTEDKSPQSRGTREVRTRYNALVRDVTQVGTWRCT
jgi:hypothetical protein